MRTLPLLVILATASSAAAQTQTITVGTSCTSACEELNADPNLGGLSPQYSTCRFLDPLPANATLTHVLVQRQMSKAFACASCGTPTVSVDVERQVVGSPVALTNVGYCTSYVPPPFDSGDYPLGFPGYTYGGTNAITFQVSNGASTLGYAQATLTYDATPKTLTTTAAEPIIPSASTLLNDCLLFRSKLEVFASKGVAPLSGVSATIVSDRNASSPVDSITEPGPTDASGHATGYLETRATGNPILVTTAPGFGTSSTTAPVQQADFQSTFLITAYYTPHETDYNGKDVTNPCGVTGSFKANFLKAVRLEGTGVATDGRFIAYEPSASCYHEAPCVQTSSGTCATADRTVAVDRSVIAYTTNLRISTVGDRFAEDVGGAIIGAHIDNYVDTLANYKKWHNIKAATVRYLGGGGQCAQ